MQIVRGITKWKAHVCHMHSLRPTVAKCGRCILILAGQEWTKKPYHGHNRHKLLGTRNYYYSSSSYGKTAHLPTVTKYVYVANQITLEQRNRLHVEGSVYPECLTFLKEVGFAYA